MTKTIHTGWEKTKIGDIADPGEKWSFTGGPFGSNLKSSDYTPNGIRIIQLQNIGDGQFNNKNKIYTSIKKADELKSCNIYPGEIILSKMGDPVARACLIPESEQRFLMASDGIRLLPDLKKYNVYFIFLAINSNYFRISAENASTGSTRKRIGLSVLRKLIILTPPLPEQNRIVEVLETWNKVLEKLNQKIKLKKNIKKGLMQKLLNGKVRLSGFSGKWQVVKLGNLCEISRGGSPRPIQNFLTNNLDGLNWLKIGDIEKGAKFITKTGSKIKKEGLKKTTEVNSGDFILSNSMSFGRPYIMKIKACIHDGWLAFKNIKTDYDSTFLYYKLITEEVQNNFLSISAGSGVQNLKKETVAEVEIKCPSIEEQTAIAKILTTADDEITALERKRNILEDQKKYLLNNLITGQIRTPENLTLPTK